MAKEQDNGSESRVKNKQILHILMCTTEIYEECLGGGGKRTFQEDKPPM
jgi:hypothetical protein